MLNVESEVLPFQFWNVVEKVSPLVERINLNIKYANNYSLQKSIASLSALQYLTISAPALTVIETLDYLSNSPLEEVKITFFPDTDLLESDEDGSKVTALLTSLESLTKFLDHIHVTDELSLFKETNLTPPPPPPPPRLRKKEQNQHFYQK